MDVLKKMFGISQPEKSEKKLNDEFKKPIWFEENETDDELFDTNRKFVFQMFTNPLELQKHFEQQMQEVLKSIREYEENGENIDRNLKDEYLKPGFENYVIDEFKKTSKSMDTDLDGEVYPDQLHSLFQRLSPDFKTALPDKKHPKVTKPKPKLSDEEVIMGRIHGTLNTENDNPPIRRRKVVVPKIPPHFGGVFEGAYQGPKMFRQSIMTQTVRKPDGSVETKKIIRDTDGKTKTTITRTVDGKTETVTTYGNENSQIQKSQKSSIIADNGENPSTSSDRNIYVAANGYALPKNLW